MIYKLIILCCCFIVSPTTSIRTRIIGGIEANKGEFPHLVTLQYSHNNKHNCGGAILNERWILTAGHCVPKRNSDYVVRAGKHNVQIAEKTQQTVNIEKSFIHSKCSPDKSGVGPFDIALLKLKTPLVFNKYVVPIKLHEDDDTLPKSDVTIAGWGTIQHPNISFPAKLQKITLPLIDLKTCNNSILFTNGNYSVLHETNVCTGPLTGGHGACYGDSGSPIITRENGHVEVIGVFSWMTLPCAAPSRVSVYVRVSAFIDWIDNIISNN